MEQGYANRAVELLLVEDNPADVLLVQEGLREAARKPCHFHLAKDGVEALAFLRGEGPFQGSPKPDLVLLDLNLPKLHGTEVLCALRREERFKRLPILIFSSSSSQKDVNASYECGANGYLCKPKELDGIYDIVRTIEHFWLDLSLLPTDKW